MALSKIKNASLGSDVSTGTVLQVVQADTTANPSSTGNTWVEYLSANITPSSTNSKILVLHTVSYGGIDNQYASYSMATLSGAGAPYKLAFAEFKYLDEPSTTSQCTYKFYCKSDAANRQIYINKAYSYPGDGYNSPPSTSVILMEIAG